jgi:hypothetical protein
MSGSHEKLLTNGPPISVAGGSVNGSTCSSPDPSGGCNFYPAPSLNVPQVTQDPLQGTPAATRPDCSALPTRDLATELARPDGIRPGQYTTLDSGNASMNMLPGIYCLTGGTLASKQSVTGNGVLIYLTDTAASISYSGKGSLDIRAPTKATTGCAGNADPSQDICKYLGILVYKVTGANTCHQNDVEIDFVGQGSMNVVGLVYAPFSLVRYGGNGSLTMTGQTIAGCVKFNGNGNINIIYNPTLVYSPPPSIRLDQ